MQTSQVYKQKQTHKMTPQLIYTPQLLTYPFPELSLFLQGLTLSNPFLEHDFNYFNEISDSDRSISYSGSQDFLNYVGNASFTDSMQVSLQIQIAALPLTRQQQEIAGLIVINTANSGYFEGDINNIASLTHSSPEEVSNTLELIQQSLDPLGICARNLGECLALQVPDSFPDSSILKQILLHDISAFADRRIIYLTRKYKIKKNILQGFYDLVVRLTPVPGDSFQTGADHTYVYPDASIRYSQEEEALVVSMSKASNLLHMNEYYEKMLKLRSLDPDAHAFLKQHYVHAGQILSSLSLRDNIYFQLLSKLAEIQESFFLYGEHRIRPLTEKNIAEQLQINPSTVSRIVTSKYIVTDWGVYPLKYFFSSKLPNDADNTSSLIVKEEIKRIIASEDAGKPYSDEEIAHILSDYEIPISRRTVSKYRMACNIPNCKKRTRFN